MKHLNYKTLAFLLFAGIFSLNAQVSTDPEEVIPDQEVKIMVDIYALDQSKDYVQNLVSDAEAGKDLYMWTWSPFEFPAGHPKANGTGTEAWKSSNELLKLTAEGNGVYSYTMIPIDFYEVEPKAVYDNDIHFLIKPKDGGGYGAPDRKSDDLSVTVDPPKLVRDPAYIFPSFFKDTDLVLFRYENDREEKESMMNIDPDNCYMFIQAELSDGSFKRIAQNSFRVGQYPQLKMEYVGNDRFEKYMIPREFFEVTDPNLTIVEITYTIQKGNYTSGTDGIGYNVVAEIGCQ